MKARLAAFVALTALAAPASAITLYSTDFTNPPTVHVGVGVTPFANGGFEMASMGAWNAQGWAGSYFANRSGGSPEGTPGATSVLTLTNLAPHTTVDLNFLLGFLESWDSTDGGCCSPDFLDILIDGVPVLVGLTANNALGSVENYGGGTELQDGPNINSVTHFNTVDTLVDMSTAASLSFAHTASTLTVGIRAYGGGWQGGGDEGWGIDSLDIQYDGVRAVNPIPEPATWALMIGGFGLVGAALRRRRTLSPDLA